MLSRFGMISSKIFITLSIIIVIITPAAISDLDLTGDGSSFEDNTALSLNPTLPSGAVSEELFSLDQSSPLHLDDSNPPTLFNLAPVSGDFISATNNHDDAFLWNDMDTDIAPSSNINNINAPNFFLDNNDNNNEKSSFQLVDCSSSESLPAFDSPLTFDTLDTPPNFAITKNRLRKREGVGQECVNPATTPPTGSRSPRRGPPSGSDLEDKFRQLLEDPEMLNRATTFAIENPNYNSACLVMTDGRLPWGVCSSGRVEEQERVRETFLTAAARGLARWRLSRATLGTFLQQTL